MPAAFAHLNVTTAYSAHYGVSWPEELAAVAAADGAQILGYTDRDGLYGVAKHIQTCIHHNIAPVIGVNLAVVWDPATTSDGQPLSAGRVTVLAASAATAGYGQAQNLGAGYQSLVRLISLAHRQTAKDGTPTLYVSQLANAARGGLYVLIGPASDVGPLCPRRKYALGRSRLRLWKKCCRRVRLMSKLSRIWPYQQNSYLLPKRCACCGQARMYNSPRYTNAVQVCHSGWRSHS